MPPSSVKPHPARRAGRGTAHLPDVRSWLPFGLVALTLLGLFAVPFYINRRTGEIARDIMEVLEPARQSLDRAEIAVAIEASSIRAYILDGESPSLERFRDARAAGDRALDRLGPLVRRIGPEAERRLADVRRLRDRWHAPHDRLLRGDITADEFLDGFTVQQEHYHALLTAMDDLRTWIVRVTNERRTAIERVERLGVALNAGLVVLALASAFLIYRLTRRLLHRARDEAGLRDAALVLSEAVEVHEVLDRVAWSAAELGAGDSAYVERIDPERGEVEVVAAAGEHLLPIGTRVPYPGSLTEQVIERGEPDRVADLAAEVERPIARVLKESCGRCAALVVPLVADEQALGALVLLRRARRPFRSHEMLQPRVLGTLAALALRRATLLEETERERAALHESEERFRQLAENLREVFWIYDPGFTRTVYVSPAYEEVWRRPVESLYENPRAFLEPIHPEDRERVEAALQRAARREYDVEYRMVRPDGEVRWIHARGFPVRNEHGEIYRIAGISEDVTNRKRDEAALRQREERERILAEASRLFAASLESEEVLRRLARLAVRHIADLCVTYGPHANGPALRLEVAGRDPATESERRELLARYPPASDHAAARVLRTGEPILLPEITDSFLAETAEDEEHLRLLRRLGASSAMIVPLVARDRTLGALTLVSSDPERRYDDGDLDFARELAGRAALAVDNARLYEIAEEARGGAERRAQEEIALRDATAAVSSAFTAEAVLYEIAGSVLRAVMADGAYVERIDSTAGEVDTVAAAGERTPPLGTSTPYAGSFTEHTVEREQPEFIPRLSAAEPPLPDELVKDCGDCSALVVPLINAGEPMGAFFLLRSAQREPFHEDEIARAHIFGNLAALAFRKIHLLEDAERRREELERVTESRARLVRGFSHDVKNPLGAADGQAELLEMDVLGELAPEQRDSLKRIRRSIRSALDLIDDLTELARAEAAQLEIEWTQHDVRGAVREIAEEYRAQADAKGLETTIELPDELPLIESDPSRIRQVLGNLISNAVKYTDEGGVHVRVDICEDRDAPGPGRWIVVDVSDTGPGIPVDKQKLLFREFMRLDPETKTGAGLGLAISHRVARALGGTITVESEPGRGSTFTLWLPLERP